MFAILEPSYHNRQKASLSNFPARPGRVPMRTFYLPSSSSSRVSHNSRGRLPLRVRSKHEASDHYTSHCCKEVRSIATIRSLLLRAFTSARLALRTICSTSRSGIASRTPCGSTKLIRLSLMGSRYGRRSPRLLSFGRHTAIDDEPNLLSDGLVSRELRSSNQQRIWARLVKHSFRSSPSSQTFVRHGTMTRLRKRFPGNVSLECDPIDLIDRIRLISRVTQQLARDTNDTG